MVANRLLAAVLAFSSMSQALRLGFLTDIHMDPDYAGYCGFPLCYDRGNYGYDTSELLLNTTLDDMLANFADPSNPNATKIDAILMSGDFVVHGLSLKDFSQQPNWAKIKSII